MTRRSTGTRRINGQGGITRVSRTGKYRVQYYDQHGTRRSMTLDTRAQSETALREALVARDNGTLARPSSQIPTLAGWFQEWLPAHVVHLAPSTATSYRGSAARISDHLGTIRLDQVTTRDIVRYQNNERDRGLGEGSLLNDHRLLKMALREAARMRLITANPLEGIKAPKPQRRPPSPLTGVECREVLDQAQRSDPMTHAMRRLNLIWGPRQSEVLGLQWGELNRAPGDLHIKRALRRDAGIGLHIKAPKSAEGIRTLHLGQDTLDAFRIWRAAQAKIHLAAPEWDAADWIFTGRAGAPIDAGRDHRNWKSLLRTAGVRPVRLHDARHTAGTLLNATGTDPRTIQAILGHADVLTTLNTYVKPTSALVAAAGDRMSKMIRQTN